MIDYIINNDDKKENKVVISISCDNSDEVKELPEAVEKGQFLDAIYLKFDDIEKPLEGYHSITDEQAEDIAKFIKKWKNCDEIIVHCYAGISRSAAVAAAIYKYYGMDDLEETFFSKSSWYIPNMLVYKKVLRALYEKV